MKILHNLFRTLPLASKFTYKYAAINTPLIKRSTLFCTLSLGFYYTTKRIISQQMNVIEIQNNLNQGEIKQIQVGPKSQDTVLVIKYNGNIYCTQSKCAHFGFDLNKGLLLGDKLICPLHNAGFSVVTGQPNQGPVYDGIKTFPVDIRNNKIILKVPKTGWDSKPVRKPLGKQNIDKSKQIVIIGGGPAAQSAVDTLRDSGYKGLIYMISKEQVGPYDRTMLSKVMNIQKAPGQIRSNEYNQENGVIFMGGETVKKINYQKKRLQLQNKKQGLHYDKVLIATGCVNRVPDIKGLDKVQYKTLRNVKDYKEINNQIRMEGVKNITIIGGGFIGLQIASAIKLELKDSVKVTIIEKGKTPLEHIFGPAVGSVFTDLCRSNNVNLLTEMEVKSIKGQNGKPKSVELSSGQVETDVLIMATGVKCATDFVSELVDKKNMGIHTNIFLETQKTDVYAAGDVASYPYWYTGQHIRIEHYNEAIYQGSVAALNMLGKKFPMDNIPFFWTRSFNNSIGVTGLIKNWDYIHIIGSLTEKKFVAYYINTSFDKVVGAAAMGVPNALQIINQAMRNGVMPNGKTVMGLNFSLENLLKDIKAKNPKCTRCTMCSV